MSDDNADHWDAVFASRDLDTVSWFEETPTHSVELLRAQPGSVIDIGAGASRLPDALLTDGRDDITLLGVPLPVVSRRLRHSSPRVTMEVYAHTLLSAEVEAAQVMDRLLRPRKEG